MARADDSALTERAQHLLRTLVERYIHDGQPVGSQRLLHDAGMDISAATVRHVMADLEALGFVSSPHTSAGRVPTVKGYRLFVDALLEVQPFEEAEIHALRSQLLGGAGETDNPLLNSTSNVLSAITEMAGVVTLPRQHSLSWRQIEFLPLSDNRVLAVLVLNPREVQNRILHLDRNYSADFLHEAANYLNAQFAGRSVSTVRARLINELKRTRASLDKRMAAAVDMAEQVVADDTGKDGNYVLTGETNLMGFAELSEIDTLRTLFEAFNEKRDILHLLDQCTSAEGVQIFIGEESGYQMLDNMSIVTAPYRVDDHVIGVLGVIGPTRMAYDRVIPIVDITAKILGSALKLDK